jgi:outer membrane beta-barrel protein
VNRHTASILAASLSFLGLIGSGLDARADELAEEADADEAVYAVQRRHFLKGHEFNVSVGVLPLDALYKGITLGFGYAYHFNPVVGWQIAHFRYSFNIDTPTVAELDTKFGTVAARIPPVEFLLDSNVLIKLLSGKAVLGQRRMVTGEIDLIVGPAASILATQQLLFGLNAGLGFRAYLSRNFSARLEVRQYELFQANPFKVNHVLDVSLSASLNIR